jgi:acylphosphatase
VSFGYSTEIEGGAPVRMRYTIAGRLDADDFMAFVAERARWFGISGWVRADGAGSVTMVAAGPEAMVGALEMACLLGPLNALVDRVEGVEETGAMAGEGFDVR